MDCARVLPSDLAFTPSVKAVQVRKGSRDAYARMERHGSWQTSITPELGRFIEAQTSVFLGTANTMGQPYVQHRGGPPGFLRVLDSQTLGFVDFRGNPAVHHARKSGRQSQGTSLTHRLCGPQAHQTVG